MLEIPGERCGRFKTVVIEKFGEPKTPIKSYIGPRARSEAEVMNFFSFNFISRNNIWVKGKSISCC